MIDLPDVLARLEQPAYTGENRCLPCTAVNVVIAITLAIGIGVATTALVGAFALTVFLGLIRLRGYLVPGTPTLTRRYLPDRVLAMFGKSPSDTLTVETVSPDTLESVLTATTVATEQGDGIRLTPSFRQQWNERLSRDGDPESRSDAVRSMLGADEIRRLGDASYVLDGRKQVRWESTAALAADVAAAAELRTRLEGWDALEVDERRDLLTGLRLLRDRCPACDSGVTTTAERLEHCCRRPRVGIRSVCEACDRPLVEVVVTESSADPWLELAGVTAANDSASDP
ncbi:hypothetical protein HYG81_16485 [Natrinema zhouii]|uniref:Uncharacterized protein n=1 Tax=Natrinema zhouii TaxID=1710539 RepID=A0A7D6GK05_9EURY|nr:hypothetical protein [Natrinema zhouii]QLK25660.1 hypothetical protein HYG81_16485 [Natrinema zhouii]